MQEIIVAIDFSNCSLHALDYAIMIANHNHANVKMIWVDNQSSPEMVFTHEEQAARQEVKGYFEEILLKYGPKLIKGKLDYKLRMGKVFNEVSAQAKHDNAFLIVTGTHGVSGFEKYWVGSNTYRIVTNAPCPVVIIRKEFTYGNSIKNIVIPIDSTKDSIEKLIFTSELAKVFDAQVHVLAVYPQMIKALKLKVDQNIEKAIQYLDKNKVKFAVETVMSDDLTGALINYATLQKVDLIAIMTEQGVTNSSVFLGPNARQIINNSPIPVMNIRPKM